jgi:hypothetical protein
MAFEVVLDHPSWNVLRGPREALTTLVGIVLMGIGLVISPLVLLLLLAPVAWVAREMEEMQGKVTEMSAWPLGHLALAWLLSLVLAVTFGYVGYRLVRGRRQIVLWLRKFGYDDATQAVSYAVARSMGRSWRLVTLDDSEVAPIGVPLTIRRASDLWSLGAQTVHFGGKVLTVLPRVAPALLVLLPLLIILDTITGPDTGKGMMPSIEKHVGAVFAVFENGGFTRPFGFDTVSAFLGVLILEVVILATLLVSIPVMLLGLPLVVPAQFLSDAAAAAEKADELSRQNLTSPEDVNRASALVAHSGRAIIAPRLVVLRVSSSIWQYAVRRLAAQSAAIIIDVSEPTSNLFWEIDELNDKYDARFVVVGEYSRVEMIRRREEIRTGDELTATLSRLLDGKKVIAYQTHKRGGMRRFSWALRNRLDSLPPLPPPKLTPADVMAQQRSQIRR